MAKNPMMYFSSDWHLGHGNEHQGIIVFERNQFKTIQEHDDYVLATIRQWANKWAPGSTFWFLGDFGDPQYFWILNIIRSFGHEVHFLLGNHDHFDEEELKRYVDYIHPYPIYLSQKLVVSHYPVAVYEDQINVCGHLHSAKLADINHINANIHIAKYQPISEKHFSTIFSQIPKFSRRFLYEPYAADYVFTQPKNDAIYDRNGRIDLGASRVWLKLAERGILKNDDNFVHDYTGGFVDE